MDYLSEGGINLLAHFAADSPEFQSLCKPIQTPMMDLWRKTNPRPRSIIPFDDWKTPDST